MAAAGCRLTACVFLLLAASSSSAGSDDLPGAVAEDLRAVTFVAVKSVAGLPESARLGLARLFGSDSLEMADPGAEFQATDVITKPNLPARRLGVAGCSPRHCIVYYERGGIAHTWSVVILQVPRSPAALLWGGSAPGGLADLNALKQALLSGRVKARTGYW
jgi:hypothetical protein